MDTKTLDLQLSQFDALKSNVLSFIKEEFVNEYNNLVNSLAVTTRQNLGSFLINPNEVKPKIVSTRPRSYSGRDEREVVYSKDKYCDDDLFQRRLQSLSKYLETQGISMSPDKTTYDMLSDGQLQEIMVNRRIKPKRVVTSRGEQWVFDHQHALSEILRQDSPSPVPISNTFNVHNSNFINQSSGASIVQHMDFKSTEFRNLVDGIRQLAQSGNLSQEARTQINIDIDTVEVQLKSPQPKEGVIHECMRSVRSILENAGGSLIASGVIAAIGRYF